MKDSLFLIVKMFLQKEQYQVNADELKLQLLSHPSYPSLHAITGVLDHFNIENLALEVPQNKETLDQLPEVFIAHIKEEKGEELVVVTKKGEKLALLFEDKSTKTTSEEAFFSMWDGIIVVIDKEEMSLPPKQYSNVFSSPYLIGGLVAMLFIGLFVVFQATLFQSFYFLLSLSGLAISIFISRHDLGFYSEQVQKFCSATEKTSCDTVLNSNGAKLFGRLKLSDLGLTYFLGLSLASVLLLIARMNDFTGLACLGLISVPIVLYTIYYQWQVIKKWCPLCLSLAAVVCMQFATLFLLDFSASDLYFNVEANGVIILSFLSAIISWAWLKPLLAKNQKLGQLEINHYKFKRNFTLFDAMHRQSPLLSTNIMTKQEISFGQRGAPLQIVAITNPLCFYCKKTHELIENILTKHEDNIEITIRFNVNLKNKADKAYLIATRILELYHKEGKAACQTALHAIYSDDADKDKWLEQWGTATEEEVYFKVLEEEQAWCHQNDIHFTPALFVNGRIFPKVYQSDDLLYFIEDLVEQEQLRIQSLQPV